MKVKGTSRTRKRLCIYLLVFIFLLTNTLPVFAEDTFRAATVSKVEGSVQIMKAGGEKQFDAFVGMSLTEGDRIITGDKASITLEIDDDKEVKLDENTQMSLSELSGKIEAQNDQTSLSLIVGKVWSNIKKKLNIRAKYEIKTPTAVMGARGTMFGVSVTISSGSSGSGSAAPAVSVNVAVLEGTVSASLQQAVADLVNNAVALKQLDVLLQKDQQIQVDQNQPLPSAPPVPEQVTNLTLDRFTLENIRDAAQQNPDRVDPTLLNNINQVIEQMKQEENNTPPPPPPPPDVPDVQQDPGSSGSSGGGSSSGNSGSSSTAAKSDDVNASNVHVYNYYGSNDYVDISGASGLSAGDIIYVYDSRYSSVPLWHGTVQHESTYYVSIQVSLQSVGGTVYISRIQSGKDVESDRIPVTYDAEVVPSYWVPVGSLGFSSPSAANVSLSFDNNGKTYVAYADGSMGNKSSVMGYNGSNWSYLGTQGFSTGAANNITVNRSSGTPYVAYSDAGADDAAVVMQHTAFGPTEWDGGAVVVASTSAMANVQVDDEGTPYVAFKDDNGVKVMRYNGTNWTGVWGYVTNDNVQSVSMFVYNDGFNKVSYIAYIDSTNNVHLKDDSDGWLEYTQFGGIASTSSNISLDVVNENGKETQYLAYKNSYDQVIVKKHTGTRALGQWYSVGDIAGTAAAAQPYISLYVDNGTPYVAYKGSNGKAMVKMYVGSSWIDLSDGGISAGVVSSISLNIHNSIPYIAFTDTATLNKVSVMGLQASEPLTALSVSTGSGNAISFSGNTMIYNVGDIINHTITVEATTSSNASITILLNGSVVQSAGTAVITLQYNVPSYITVLVEEVGKAPRVYAVCVKYYAP